MESLKPAIVLQVLTESGTESQIWLYWGRMNGDVYLLRSLGYGSLKLSSSCVYIRDSEVLKTDVNKGPSAFKEGSKFDAGPTLYKGLPT